MHLTHDLVPFGTSGRTLKRVSVTGARLTGAAMESIRKLYQENLFCSPEQNITWSNIGRATSLCARWARRGKQTSETSVIILEFALDDESVEIFMLDSERAYTVLQTVQDEIYGPADYYFTSDLVESYLEFCNIAQPVEPDLGLLRELVRAKSEELAHSGHEPGVDNYLVD
jgi:hypothetical protein